MIFLKKNEFIEGALIATIAIILSKILGVLYVIPFYNIIGENGGSLYGYAYNIYNFFLIISSAGIPLAISKITSEYNTLGKLKEKTYMFKYSKKIIRYDPDNARDQSSLFLHDKNDSGGSGSQSNW